MEPDGVSSPLSQFPETATVLQKLMAAAEIPSFRALARTAGVSDWAVQQLRRDRIAQMRITTLRQLARALKLSLVELLTQFEAVDAEAPVEANPQPQMAIEGTMEDKSLPAEYQRLQAQLDAQETVLRDRFQREVLTVIEPWLLQWPTVVHAVENTPELPASRLVPLVQPLQTLLDQWGIAAIAPVGSEVPYNPRYHQLMAGTAAPGEPVKVRYAGFVQGDALLYRAKVSPAKA